MHISGIYRVAGDAGDDFLDQLLLNVISREIGKVVDKCFMDEYAIVISAMAQKNAATEFIYRTHFVLSRSNRSEKLYKFDEKFGGIEYADKESKSYTYFDAGNYYEYAGDWGEMCIVESGMFAVNGCLIYRKTANLCDQGIAQLKRLVKSAYAVYAGWYIKPGRCGEVLHTVQPIRD